MSAQNLETVSDPWSLKPGWWKELTETRDDHTNIRVQELIQSLQPLETQIPEENRSLIRAAVEKISKNTNQFLLLMTKKGWKIEPAPTPLDVYSINELLEVAKLVKQDESELLDTAERLDRLTAILKQARGREDELYVDYLETTEKSLQRTLKGLSLMVSVTSRAVLEEKIRILQEKRSGIEERSAWNKNLLKIAKERVSPTSLDITTIDNQITEASERKINFKKDLLQIEAELVPNGVGDQIDDRSLIAIIKLILYSKD